MPLDTDKLLFDLAQGQTKTQQMLTDVSNRLFGVDGNPGILRSMHEEHKEQFKILDTADKATDTRVDNIEKKIFWFSGAGTATGGILGYLIQLFTHRGAH